MRKEQKEIDRLGPLGIGGEVFNFSWTHWKFFTIIQVTFMLPLVALGTLAAGYGLDWKAQQNGPGPAARADAPLLPSNGGASFHADTIGLQQGLAIVALVLVWAVTIFFFAAIVSLPSAAIIYAAGLHYTGQIVSFLDVVRAVVPRLWMRLTITQIYYILVLHGMAIGQFVVEVLLVELDPVEALPRVQALGVLGFIGLICLDIMLRLASGVAVLEKDYGWAALRRAPKLLRGRVRVALLFQWLSVGSFVKFLKLERMMYSQAAKAAQAAQAASGDSSPSENIDSVIVTVYFILGLCFFWQMSAVSSGVQYASFKAYRNEDLDESFFEKRAMKVEYELIGSGTVDAKLGEHDTQSLV